MKSRVSKRIFLKGKFNLCFLRRTFYIIIIIVFIYNVSFYFNQNSFFKDRLSAISVLTEDIQRPFLRKQDDYGLFLEEIEGKNIFSFSDIKQSAFSSGTQREKIIKIIEDLRLAGIISVVPKMAIIENTKIGKIFYLGEGDSFFGDIKVEKIKKDSVILNKGGAGCELYL